MPCDTTPDPIAVKQALRALAVGTAPATPTATRGRTTAGVVATVEEATTIVGEAATAFVDVREAAEFVDGGGLDRLRTAVDAAHRLDDRELARAGQRLLARAEHYQSVATDTNRPERTDPTVTGPTRQSHAGDHFHPGRGTVLSADSQVRTE